MKQLNKRFYPRAEIAEITGVNIEDNRHFKRNITNKLDKWGYKYIYEKKGITITIIPLSAEERFNEVLRRDYGFSIYDDTRAFACFLMLFLENEGFNSMPWNMRKQLLEEKYNEDVSISTLKSWYKKLEKSNLLFTDTGKKTAWYTKQTETGTIRKKVETPTEKLNKRNWYEKKRKYLKDGLSYTETMKKLWYETHTFYFLCADISLNACGDNAIFILDLVKEWLEGK